MIVSGFNEIASVVASGGALIKALSVVPWRRKVDPKEDYRFAKEFLGDLESRKDMPSYLREMGYRALVRGAKVAPELIDCAIKVKNYPDALVDCSKGYPYLEVRRAGAEAHLSFKPGFEEESSRKRFRVFCFAGYAISYVVATSPAIVNGLFSPGNPQYMWLLILTLPSFLPLSFWSLRKGARMQAAERLVSKDREQLAQAALPALS